MNFILVLVTSSAYFLPSSISMTTFNDEVTCNQALIEAKKHWQTVNVESKCINLENEVKKEELEKQLKELK